MISIHEISWESEVFQLTPQRAVFWPKESILFCSDLHWGKVESFQAHGLALPSGMLKKDLQRLSGLVRFFSPKQLFFLGDLIHHPSGLSEEVIDQVKTWKAEFKNLHWALVEGNHDRIDPEILRQWDIENLGTSVEVGRFRFSHDPIETSERPTWHGHWHPTVRLYSPSDKLRVSCYYFHEKTAVLPAFSHFTRGLIVQKTKASDRIFAIGEKEIFEV